MASIGEKDLFKANSLYKLVRGIKAYPTPTNTYKWNLGYRRAFKWATNCRNSEKYGLEEAKIKFKLEMENSYIFGLMVVAVINFVYGGLLLPFTFAN